MYNSKPEPLFAPRRERRHCPVCGEVSYSRHGVHPQCAQRRADDVQKQELREEQKRAENSPDEPAPELKAWHRRCPRCEAQVHLRKPACACGYEFPKKRSRRAE